MSEPALRKLLSEVAAQAGPLPPGAAEVAADRAERRRARRVAALTAAVLALVLVAFTGVLPGAGRPPATGQPGAPAAADLPDRLRWPPLWVPQVTRSPPGRAVAIFGGEAPFPRGEELRTSHQLFVVGHAPGAYRVTGSHHVPAEGLRLAPDGGTVAMPGTGPVLSPARRDQLVLLDLRDGRTRTVSVAPYVRVSPVGWAPDGRAVLVALERPGRDDTAKEWHLGIVDVASGTSRVLDRPDNLGPDLGHAGAFSPDGRSVAYDTGPTVTVRGLDGGARTIPKPPDASLAGVGAWTPDGRSLALVQRTGCCLENQPATWRVLLVDVGTGARQPSSYPDFRGAGLRVLGWRGQSPVVELGHGTVYDRPGRPATLENIHDVDIAVLLPGGTAPVTLISGPGGSSHIDVAPGLVSAGTVGPWPRPDRWPVDPGWARRGAALVVAGVVTGVLLVLVLVLRRRRTAGRG